MLFFPFSFTLFFFLLLTEGVQRGKFPPLAGRRGSAPAENFFVSPPLAKGHKIFAISHDQLDKFRRSGNMKLLSASLVCQSAVRRDRHYSCAAVRGTTITITAARRAVTGTNLIIGTTTSGVVWCVRGEYSFMSESAQGIASSAQRGVQTCSGERGDALRISSDRRRVGRRKPNTRLRFFISGAASGDSKQNVMRI